VFVPSPSPLSPPVHQADLTQRRARDPESSFWVTASAGGGKTKLLCDRVVSLLCHGADPRSILCLTYTRAAASEMKNRVLSLLQKIAHRDPAYTDFHDLLCQRGVDPVRFCLSLMDDQHLLSFQTIHAFCERLLRRFPLEANIAPDFKVLEEEEAQTLLAQAAEGFYDLDTIQGDAGTATLLARYLHEGQYQDVLKPLIRKRYLLYQAVMMPEAMFRDALKEQLLLPPGTEDLEALQKESRTSLPDDALQRIAAALAVSPSEKDREKGDFFTSFLAVPHPQRDYEGYADFFLTDKETVRKTLATQKAPLFPEDRASLAEEAIRLYTLRQQIYAAECVEATVALRSVATAVWASYITAKEAAGALDFDDLLEGTHRLLQDHNAWIAYKLEHALKHILLDEAQDTNPHQWTLIKHLLAETLAGDTETRKTLLVVGDYKQSIYRFQDADPDAYRAEYDTLQARYGEAEKSLTPLQLNTSFRTTPDVLGLVDDVFQKTPCGQGVVTSGDAPLIHHPARTQSRGQVVLHPLMVLPPKNAEETFILPTHPRQGQSPEDQIADTIATAIQDLLSNGQGLPSRQNQPITAPDIWILLQRRGKLQHSLLSALSARNIPVAGGDRILLKETLAVKDLSALLLFMVEPEDDFTLACLLKSPIGGLTEDELFTLCHGRSGTVWSSLYDHAHQDQAPPVFGRVYALLQHFLNHADVWTPHQTLSHYLYEQGGYAAFREAFGREVDEIVHLFLTYALKFEEDVTPTLAGFLPWFERHAVNIKRETLGQGVRIQTVHGAKGLEAPVIILADAGHRPTPRPSPVVWLPQGFLWVLPKRTLHVLTPLKEDLKQQDEEEYHRLLYVAMTRAEDALHIFGASRQAAAPEETLPEHPTWYQALASQIKIQGQPLEGNSENPAYAVGALPRASTPPVHNTPETSTLPNWLTLPSPDPEDSKPTASADSEAITLGLAIHSGMQHCLAGNVQREDDLCEILLSFYDASIAKTAATRAWAAYQDQPFQSLLNQSYRVETEVALCHQGKMLRLDALLISDDHLIIVDFKSGDTTRADLQMGNYEQALRALYPHHTIESRVVGV
jgi:ATP-dependent helicase/nuclease subunit A